MNERNLAAIISGFGGSSGAAVSVQYPDFSGHQSADFFCGGSADSSDFGFLTSEDMEFYDEKGKNKIQGHGEQSNTNNNRYQAVTLTAEKGIDSQIFEDLISIVDTGKVLPPTADATSANSSTSGVNGAQSPLPNFSPTFFDGGGGRKRRPTPPAPSQPMRIQQNNHQQPMTAAAGGGGLAMSPPQTSAGYTPNMVLGATASSLSRECLLGSSPPPSRNTSFQGEHQTEATNSNQKKLFYSSLGYQSVPGLRLSDRAPSISPSGGGRSSQQGPQRHPSGGSSSGRLSCSPPVRSGARRLSVSSTSGCSPTRTSGSSLSGRARRNSCEQKMSCSPPGWSSPSTWSTLAGVPPPSTPSPLPTTSWGGTASSPPHQGGGAGLMTQHQNQYPSDSLVTATTFLPGAPYGHRNQTPAPNRTVTNGGGVVAGTSNPNNNFPSTSTGMSTSNNNFPPGVPTSSNNFLNNTMASTSLGVGGGKVGGSSQQSTILGNQVHPFSSQTTSPNTPSTISSQPENHNNLENQSSSASQLSATDRRRSGEGEGSVQGGGRVDTLPPPPGAPPKGGSSGGVDTLALTTAIRPENSILRQQLQGKLSNRYNETVSCRHCGKMLTVKCIMGTCLKSDEVLCQSCNMELTVKCILGSCKTPS
eukprot:TRINITY_DN6712_c0_g1_i3.p1 TRINITY_DN6712_c0_g1~~TRINITY_DN6712_c0_g1_i3.p1  ORF type:complete len:644 (-),score=117.86 TRINITY_DN6712_c0_g1_i3:157-2088(-)